MKNYNQKLGDLGQVWTPIDIIKEMISIKKNLGQTLEPSAGCGNFLPFLGNNCVALEIDKNVIPKDLYSKYKIINFFDYPVSNKFDTIIGNPPYVAGRLIDNEIFKNWPMKSPKTANFFIHFIEKCLSHLNENGELIFIVPSSFLSDTSFGSNVRSEMMKTGSFTHIYFKNNIKWNNAKINDILIFRWQKSLKTNIVETDSGKRIIYESNGFIWLLNFEPKATIQKYFKAGVGSAPLNSDILNGNISQNSDFYFKEGKLIKICENNKKNWPRSRETKKCDKIFFVGRQTRKWPIFSFGNYEKHIDWVLIPKVNIKINNNIALFFNNWFKKNGQQLGLIKNGRWKVGIKQIENCPIDQNFIDMINS